MMFEEQAIALLKMMGHSGTVPGAVMAKDIPAALSRLQAALAQQEPQGAPPVKAGEEQPVTLSHRAWPLVKMLEQAVAEESEVMWDY